MAIEEISDNDRATESDERRSARRKLLALGAAGIGLVAGSALGAGKAAASHTPPLEGSSSVTAVPGVEGEHHTDGPGIHGTSVSGVGVSGFTAGGLQAIHGFNAKNDTNAWGVRGVGINGVIGLSVGIGPGARPSGTGVLGVSELGAGVRGETTSNGHAGVEGHNADTGFNAAGVRGTIAAPTGNGMGVDGQAVNGVGVSGTSHNYIGVSAGSLRGVAFQAFSIGHRAINVAGKSGFSTVGAGTVFAGSSSAVVTHLLVTADSHITVALTSDPGNSAVVQWIERTPGSGFTLHMDRRVRDATSFSFFIVEPFAPLTGPVTP